MRCDNEVNVVRQPTNGENRHDNDHHFHNLQTELNTFYHVKSTSDIENICIFAWLEKYCNLVGTDQS